MAKAVKKEAADKKHSLKSTAEKAPKAVSDAPKGINPQVWKNLPQSEKDKLLERLAGEQKPPEAEQAENQGDDAA